MSKAAIKFKLRNSLSYRKRKYQQVISSEKALNRLPIICIMDDDQCRFKGVQVMKFLCEKDMTVALLLIAIRKRLEEHKRGLYRTEAIFLLIGRDQQMVSSEENMENIYNQYKDEEDEFMYITVCIERTFG